MNFLAARGAAQGIEVAGRTLATPHVALSALGAFTLGVRPEYVRSPPRTRPVRCPAVVTQAQDIGTYWLVTARIGSGADEALLRARLSPEQAIPRVGEAVWLSIVGEHTCYYLDEELIA